VRVNIHVPHILKPCGAALVFCSACQRLSSTIRKMTV